MKHFTRPSDKTVHAFEEDGSQDHLIESGMEPIAEQEVQTYLSQNIPVEVKAQHIRWSRDAMLTQSDWTQLPDVPVATKEKWKAYRQALRDVTEQPSFPENVVWPTSP